MNPLSLLTKGRTFVGFKNRPTAYKLSKGMAVPKFTPGKALPVPPPVPPTPSHEETADSQSLTAQPPLFPHSETQTSPQTRPQPHPESQTNSAAKTGAISNLAQAANPITPAQAQDRVPTGILSYDSVPNHPPRNINKAARPEIPAASTGILSYDSMPNSKKSGGSCQPAMAPVPRHESTAKSIFTPHSASQSPQQLRPARSVSSFFPERSQTISKLGAVCLQLFKRWSPARKAPPFSAPTVQTELALEKVTVVRNDLSDDDLEVVGMGKKKSTQYDQCQALSTNR